jgi:transcription antitermination factor NusG
MADVMTGRKWYALKTVPQREFTARDRLQRYARVECFVPTELKYPRPRGSREVDKTANPRRYPYFPGYLFAAFEAHEGVPLHRLEDYGLIMGVVGFGGVPFAIPPAAIVRMMGMGETVPHRAAPSPHKSFAVGQTVDVIGGAWSDRTLPIVGIDAKMAQFLIQFMGKPQLIKVPLEFLRDAA